MIGKLDQPTAPAVFVSGRSGFLLGGDWNRPTLADAQAKHQLSFDYEIIPIPKFFQTARSWADSHSFAMPGKSNQLSRKSLQRCCNSSPLSRSTPWFGPRADTFRPICL